MFGWFRRIESKLDTLLRLAGCEGAALLTLKKAITDMSPEFQKLSDDVAATKSATLALAGIKAQLDAALASSDPPAALKALSDSLEATNASLAAAIVANTSHADPAPAPVTEPEPATDPAPVAAPADTTG